jgi:hypothetical protein
MAPDCNRHVRVRFWRDAQETGVMKKLIFLSLAMATALSVVGCDTPQGQNAAGGAVIGGATGALLGGALSNSAGGAIVGGIAGAATGAMIGSAATPPGPGYYPPGPPPPPPGRCAEWYYDYYGNRVCRAYY